MHGKEFVNDLITSYVTVVTLITAVMLVLGLRYYPNASFGYGVFAAPLIYGACGVLPNMVMYSHRELTVKEFLVRKIIQFVLTEVIIFAVAFYGIEIQKEHFSIMLGMGIGILSVYVLAHVIEWIQSCLSAKRMTRDLIRFQQNNRILE